MRYLQILLLVGLLTALLGACSAPDQPGATASPAAAPTVGQAPTTANSAYPGPQAENPYPTGSEPTTAAEGPLVVPEPASGTGNVTGTLLRELNDGSRVPIEQGVLYLGVPVHSEGGVQALIQVDKLTAPSAITNADGEFAFVNVPPGTYGLMYDTMQGTLLLNHPETGDNMLIEVADGQTEDMGELWYPIPEGG